MKYILRRENFPMHISLLCMHICYLILLLNIISTHAFAQEPDQPNILIILADDLGYEDVGVHGLKKIDTPAIDSIAANGILFTNGYVSAPVCSPTRAGLLTGRYQQRFGYGGNPHNWSVDPEILGLPMSETTIAERLKESGYHTGIIGKWHLGVMEKFHPNNRGFDEFFGFVGGQRSYFPEAVLDPTLTPRQLNLNAPLERNGEPVEWEGYLTDVLGYEANDFIRRNTDNPFLLYLSFNAPHVPMEATNTYISRVPADVVDEKRRVYLAMLVAMDDAIGRVLETLRELNLEEKTLVFFLSDNGGALAGRSANGSSNAPLRDGKSSVYEGGIRVPFMMQWMGHLPASVIYDEPVIQLDILPTALAAAGVTISTSWMLDGVNLLPYLRTDTAAPPHSALFWRYPDEKKWAIRKGDWKLVNKQTFFLLLLDKRGGDQKRNYTIVPMPNTFQPQLFDLSNDITEIKDIATEHPEIVSKLLRDWESWNDQLPDPLW